MEIMLNKKKYKTGKITFQIFRKGIEYSKALHEGSFLAANYEMSELDEAVDFVCLAFGNQFTSEEFHEGFEMEDGTDFMKLFNNVLYNVQMTEEKRLFLAEKAAKEAEQVQEKK